MTSLQREKRAFDLIQGSVLRDVSLSPAPNIEFGGYYGQIRKYTQNDHSSVTSNGVPVGAGLPHGRQPKQNEFIEKAITHYQDLLEAEQNETLPAAIQSAIDGRLGMFEDRLARLLYKLTVEMDMGISAVLDCVQLDAGYLRKLRADSVKSVKATNGLLTFEQKSKALEIGAEGDDPWQD